MIAKYRKTVFRVTFTEVTINGDAQHGTKWFESITSIPEKYFEKDNAKLWKRSFDVFPRPTIQQLKEAVATGNKWWLNTNEVIEEQFFYFSHNS